MTEWNPPLPDAPRQAWRRGFFVAVRATLSVTVLFAAYFLIPTREHGKGSDVPWLILELVLFAAIVAIQVPAIVKATHPVLRAIEALAIVLPVYLLIFSRLYLANSHHDPSGFSRPLDHVSALYFTVTTFSSTGFGDITASNHSMMLLVTLQMILNLVVLGVVIRVLASAALRGVARRDEPDPASNAAEPRED